MIVITGLLAQAGKDVALGRSRSLPPRHPQVPRSAVLRAERGGRSFREVGHRSMHCPVPTSGAGPLSHSLTPLFPKALRNIREAPRNINTSKTWSLPSSTQIFKDTCDPHTPVYNVNTRCHGREGERPDIHQELLERFHARKT